MGRDRGERRPGVQGEHEKAPRRFDDGRPTIDDPPKAERRLSNGVDRKRAYPYRSRAGKVRLAHGISPRNRFARPRSSSGSAVKTQTVTLGR
jgi:hypothetical protein